MLRFLHTADWQIGKPYGRVPEGRKRVLLQQERLHAIGRIAAVARERQVAFVLVAGDLFDSPTVPPEAVLEVLEAIGAMERPVLVIPGNHDHGAPGSVWHTPFFQAEQRRRAPNLQVLLERQPLELEQAIVLPCPLLRRTDSHDPTAWVRQLDWSTLPADKPRLLLAHGSVQGFGAADLDTHLDADEENPASASNRLQLDAPLLEQLDYVALGDWHGLKQVNPRSWYSGTPEPDRFPRNDDYQGGQVLAVTAQRGQLPAVQPRPTACLRWLPLRVELQSSADVERLERQLEQLLGDEPGQQLLLLEEQGSLSLEGHRRYDALLERWEAQLLRLKRRGRCGTSPDAQELAELCGRSDDPLIARVASDLQQELSTSSDPDDTAVLQLALAELHRCLRAEPCA
ncbi:MAG: exonuclease SbcCD subunit D [Vulcanococcus sp.]